MLNPSKLPKELWAEACNTATYLLNRTGKSSIETKSPYELWHGRPVGSLNHLKIFGTECYVHINKNFRSKFDDKTVHGHLVGYVNDRDGFRVWIPTQRKIVLSHDVRFKPEVVCNVRVNTYKLENSCEKHASSEVQKPEEVNDDEKKNGVKLKNLYQCPAPEEVMFQLKKMSKKRQQGKKRESKKPWWMTSGDFVYMAGSSITETRIQIPTLKCCSLLTEKWLKALKEELDSLEKNTGCWSNVQKMCKS